MKEMAVRYRDYAIWINEDDKSIVPVGEPSKPLTAVPRQMKSLTSVNQNTLLAIDHDYHVCRLVSSVIFISAIPEHSKDSFYKGCQCHCER
jgi:hypothetical protein